MTATSQAACWGLLPQIKTCLFRMSMFVGVLAHTVKALFATTMPDVLCLVSHILIQRLTSPRCAFRWSIFPVCDRQSGFAVRQHLQEEREQLVCIAVVCWWQRADVLCDCLALFISALFLASSQIKHNCHPSHSSSVTIKTHPTFTSTACLLFTLVSVLRLYNNDYFTIVYVLRMFLLY